MSDGMQGVFKILGRVAAADPGVLIGSGSDFLNEVGSISNALIK